MSFSFAAELSGQSSKNDVAQNAALPLCINDAKEMTQIEALQKANAKSPHKYRGYRQALASNSDTQLYARLVYAETLAANCPGKEQKILPFISAAIGWRIHKRKGDVKSVVFQRDQFSSSLNHYKESRYRDFLCPENAELWSIALAEAQKISKAKFSADVLPADTVNYYLPLHFPNDKNSNPFSLSESSFKSYDDIKDCVKFYRNPRWK